MAAIRSEPARDSSNPVRSVVEWVKENSLSLAMFSLFVGCLVAGGVAGLRSFNEQQASQGFAQIGYWQYLQTGAFLNGLFLNWQAAFLQLTTLIIFSEFMSQRGASHSRKPEEEKEEEVGSQRSGGQGKQENHHQRQKQAKPDRQGKADEQQKSQDKSKGDSKQDNRPRWQATWLYRNSLSLAFVLMFSGAFAAHVITGAAHYNELRALLNQPPVSTLDFLTSAKMWSATFSTWEAEFFVMWFFLIASIYLRQEYSAESKALGAGIKDTGEANE